MPVNEKSLELWFWDAACVIRGEKDAVKYKDVQDCFVAVKCVIF